MEKEMKLERKRRFMKNEYKYCKNVIPGNKDSCGIEREMKADKFYVCEIRFVAALILAIFILTIIAQPIFSNDELIITSPVVSGLTITLLIFLFENSEIFHTA